MDGFSPRHAYVLDVFSHAASLLSAIEALEDIHVYIGGFPQPRTYQRLGITQDKWIHYHFTHYALIVVAIYDTSLLLTNAVFALGLDPKVCNNETVLGNTHVVRTAVKAAFGQLESVTSRYRHPRNLFAHRSQIPKLELLDILEMFSLVQRYSEPVLEPQRLDALYQIAKSEIAAALAAQTAAEIQGIQSLLTALDPTYRRKRSELDAKPTGSSPRATLAT